MVDIDLRLKGYLIDKLDEEDFLESQILKFQNLLTDAESRLAHARDYIMYIQAILRKESVDEILCPVPETNPQVQVD